MKVYKLYRQHNCWPWTLTFVSDIFLRFDVVPTYNHADVSMSVTLLVALRPWHFHQVWQLHPSEGPSVTFSPTPLFVLTEALKTAASWQRFDKGQELKPGKWPTDLVTVHSVNASHMSQSASLLGSTLFSESSIFQPLDAVVKLKLWFQGLNSLKSHSLTRISNHCHLFLSIIQRTTLWSWLWTEERVWLEKLRPVKPRCLRKVLDRRIFSCCPADHLMKNIRSKMSS